MRLNVLLLLLPSFVFPQGVLSFGAENVIASSSDEGLELVWRKTGTSPSMVYLSADGKKKVFAMKTAPGNYVVSCQKTDDWDDEVAFECSQKESSGIELSTELSLKKEKKYTIEIKDRFSSRQTEFYTLSVSSSGSILLQKKL